MTEFSDNPPMAGPPSPAAGEASSSPVPQGGVRADASPRGLRSRRRRRLPAAGRRDLDGDGAPPEGPGRPVVLQGGGDDGPGAPRPRVRKLRLVFILVGLGLIALVSMLFGMMMAVASDLPSLDRFARLSNAENSKIYDDQGKLLGVLNAPESRFYLKDLRRDVNAVAQHAIISVEDKRFYGNQGFDVRGTMRALQTDVLHARATQGASTITQQFIKNALAAQSQRTVFVKLREAALAYHLTRKWSKDRILLAYLNTIYFGEGAYGIESAARVYFGKQLGFPTSCGDEQLPRCASRLDPAQSALLAGLIANPAGFDPLLHPSAAQARRRIVLRDMLDQRYITHDKYVSALAVPLPGRQDLLAPAESTAAPFFTSWVKSYLLAKYSPQRVFNGGLRVKSTLNAKMQSAAEEAVNSHLSGAGPGAALVAVQNNTGEVKAMVGNGPSENYGLHPFSVAVNGRRQPGSSFKAFVLATALEHGISLDSQWASRKKDFIVPNSRGQEHFVVNNFQHKYLGSASLLDATTYSDNSVFAEVGIKVGTKNIAANAKSFGIRSPLSTNPSMTIGGLKEGVSPLDMAHAFESFAHGGNKVCGSLSAPGCGPAGVQEIDEPGKPSRLNQVSDVPVMPPGIASQVTSALQTVIQSGTAKSAAWGGFAAGKTGTTDNYGDAWFIGYTHDLTVAVWVGYPNHVKSMATDYSGGPVEGGTYPADIWHDFVTNAEAVLQQQRQDAANAAAQAGATGPTGPQGSSTDTTGSTDSGTNSSSTDTSGSSGSSSSTGSGSSRSGSGAGSSPSGRSGSGSSGSGSGSGSSGSGGGGSGSGGSGSGSGGSGSGSGGSAAAGGATPGR